MGELGAPPRRKVKRKVSQLGQEPEARRARDGALSGGARGGGRAAERPWGGRPGDTSGFTNFGERSHFPALLTGCRSHRAGGHPGSMVLSHGLSDGLLTPDLKHKSAAELPARSSESGVLLSVGGTLGGSNAEVLPCSLGDCDRFCTGSAGTFY